MHQQWQIINRS